MQLYPVNKQPPEAPFWRLILVATSVGVFLLIAGFTIKAFGGFEMPLARAMNSLNHGLFETLAKDFYHYFGPTFAIVGTVVITAIIAISKRSLKEASTFAFMVAASWLPVGILKTIVDRPRPDATLLPHPFHEIQLDGSFPSGHTAFLAALVVALVYLAVTVRARVAIAIIGGVAVLAGAFLLTVTGVHYPSDVTASIVWVLAFAPLAYDFWVRICLPRLPFIK